MCGFVGIATTQDRPDSVDERTLAAMRDTMTHRGPDDAGLYSAPGAALAHRRLAVIDPTPAGHQPIATPDGRLVLVYNGELYNDPDLRRDLTAIGVRFRSVCDTETVLHALARWGPGATARFRGMFALALLDRAERTLTLARDPLGVKPLYTHQRSTPDGPELVFASEIQAILAHPDIDPRPDHATVSAYLSTLRTNLGSRTLFEGVETLRPGEQRVYDLRSPTLAFERTLIEMPAPAASDTGAVIRDAVESHRRADVPTCALLSGGLDSTIIAAIVRPSASALHTYCSGAPSGATDDDLAVAARVATALDTHHTEAPVTRELFNERWPELIDRTGLPVSTPNTIAINEVARTIRATGRVVALSGEGADELFGGYAPALELADLYDAIVGDKPSGGRFHLESNQWAPLNAKAQLLTPAALDAADHDRALVTQYESDFALAGASADTPMQAHLRFHRMVNLPNLLERLDLATMLESVEGRTPFADARVCAHAEALPVPRKFDRGFAGDPPRTKIALRDAFRGAVPAEALERPKASFPLPFTEWATDHAGALDASDWARETFTPGARDLVTQTPAAAWQLAWPMLNLAMWAERWWGSGLARALSRPAARSA